MSKFFSLRLHFQGWLAFLIILSGFSFQSSAAQLSTTPPKKTDAATKSTSLFKFPSIEETPNIELINAMGGAFNTIAVAGNYVYFGQGSLLITLDVSDPEHPVRCSKIMLPGIVRDVNVAQGLIYIANDNWGVQILDIRNPAIPLLLGSIDTPGQARAIDVQGEMLFVADGDQGLQIIIHSRPDEPKLIGGFPNISGSATDVQVDGNYAYLLYGKTYYGRYSATLTKFDVSNPGKPSELDSYYAEAAFKMYIRDGLGYIPNLAYKGFEIISVETMSPLGAYPGYGYYDVQVHRGLAYVTQNNQLLILDVHNPVKPTLSKTLGGSVIDFEVVDSKVYNLTSTGVEIIDLTDWENPKYIVSYTSDPTYYGTRKIQSMNGLVYVVSGTHLYTLDIRNLDRPQLISDYAELNQSWDLRVSDDFAYIAARYGGLKIIDITNPQTPALVNTYPGIVDQLDIDQNRAFIVNNGWLEVLDISNPFNPLLLGRLGELSGRLSYAGPFKVVDDLAYIPSVYDSPWGLNIFDVRDPKNINLIGRYLTGLEILDVEIKGNLAFISINKGYGVNGSIQVIDVSVPAHPTLVSEIITSGTSYDIQVAGEYLYSIVRSEGLQIFDIRDPSMPKLYGSLQTPGDLTVSLDVSVHRVIIHEYDSGFHILWAAPPESVLVSAEGGSLISDLDRVSYTFSPGTFTQTAKITHIAKYPGNKASTGDLVGVAPLFEVTATVSDTNQIIQPEQPFTIQLEYTEAGLGTAIEQTLAVYSWNGSTWVVEPSSIADHTTNTIYAQLDHMGIWTVLGETHRWFLPFSVKKAWANSGN